MDEVAENALRVQPVQRPKQRHTHPFEARQFKMVGNPVFGKFPITAERERF